MTKCPKSPDGKHQFLGDVCIWCEAKRSVEVETPRKKHKGKRLKGWEPQKPPSPEYCKTIRELAVQAVYAEWNRTKKPSTLHIIYKRVIPRIKTFIATAQYDKWKKQWRIPSKRTVDRRVNEASDPRFYPDGIPKIVAVKAGLYTINPKLIEAAHLLQPFRKAVEKKRKTLP